MITGFFDIEFRLEELSKNGDPLLLLNACVDWKLFRNDRRLSARNSERVLRNERLHERTS